MSDFDRVYLTGFGDLFITQGEQESLTVEADDNLVQYVTTRVENGTLVLDSPFASGSIEFHLRVKGITGLGATGGEDVSWTSLDTDHLELVISGAGEIDIDSLTAEELAAHLSGTGDVHLAGRVVEQGLFSAARTTITPPGYRAKQPSLRLAERAPSLSG